MGGDCQVFFVGGHGGFFYMDVLFFSTDGHGCFFVFPQISRITLIKKGLRGEVILSHVSFTLYDTHCSEVFVFSTDAHGWTRISVYWGVGT